MSMQKQINFNLGSGGTTAILGAGNGFTINIIEFTLSQSAASFVTISLQDTSGTQIWGRTLSSFAAGNPCDYVSVQNLNLPATTSGGLKLVTTFGGGAGTQSVNGSVVYTIP